MSCIVQKFGGTSVATLERIRSVAEIIACEFHQSHKVIAVVSAMAGVTNKFIGYAQNLMACEGNPEYDHLISSGEMVTSGLIAIALQNIGLKARAYAAWQIPIITSDNYGQAVIQSVDPSLLLRDMSMGIIPVVAGFQGINSENRITTLGRGGSDLTAVAISSAVHADVCEIYSDVDGVYTVDPNIYPAAKKIDKINYNAMLEMSVCGAKILQEQSLSYAMQKNVVIKVASSFIKNTGTIISNETLLKKFCGISVTQSVVPIKITHTKESHSSDIISLLKKYYIYAEIFYRDYENRQIILMIDKNKVPLAINILKKSSCIIKVKREIIKKCFSCISVIWDTVVDDNLVVDFLASQYIEVFCFSIRTYSINMVIQSEQLLKAVSVLHEYCGLNQ